MASFKVAVGDNVAYSANFLRSIGCHTGDMPQARGVVESTQQFGQMVLATIKWDCDMPPKVNVANLAKVGPNTRFCAC